MELSDQQVMDLFRELGEIKARIGDGPLKCPVHEVEIVDLKKDVREIKEKLGAVQTVIGKKELIVAAFGALGFGMMWALKALAAWVGGKA